MVNEWICWFGAPDYIHSDQGRKFKANLFTELCQLLGLTKTRTSPYHPQSDGLVGRLNQTPLMMLSIAVEEDKEKWDEHLPVLMVAYHLSVHDTTGFTPIYLMYGREIQLPLDVMIGQAPETMHNRVEYTSKLHSRLEREFELVCEGTRSVQQRQKEIYDHYVMGRRFNVGDRVWLHSPVVGRGKWRKFHKQWRGPFRVVKALSDITY